MPLPSLPLVLGKGQGGAALTNTTTPTSILPAGAAPTINGNTLQVNDIIRITLRGKISTVVTTPGTLTFDVRLGPTANIVISALGAMALNVTSQSNATFDLEILAQLVSIGRSTAATAIVTAKFTSRASLNAPAVGTTNGVGVVPLPDTAPAAGTGFDSGVSNLCDVFATWSVASASNSITVQQALVELI